MIKKGPNEVIRAKAQDGGVPTLRASLCASSLANSLFRVNTCNLTNCSVSSKNMGHCLQKSRTHYYFEKVLLDNAILSP